MFIAQKNYIFILFAIFQKKKDQKHVSLVSNVDIRVKKFFDWFSFLELGSFHRGCGE
jgi:hypothetical protein